MYCSSFLSKNLKISNGSGWCSFYRECRDDFQRVISGRETLAGFEGCVDVARRSTSVALALRESPYERAGGAVLCFARVCAHRYLALPIDPRANRPTSQYSTVCDSAQSPVIRGTTDTPAQDQPPTNPSPSARPILPSSQRQRPQPAAPKHPELTQARFARIRAAGRQAGRASSPRTQSVH